ncbi:E-selectin-like [Branchiostoma floridae x Branchiostoma japonicum]
MRVIIGVVLCLTVVVYVAPVGGRRVRKRCKPLEFEGTTSECDKDPNADGWYPAGTVCTFDCVEGCAPCDGAPSSPEGSYSECDPDEPTFPAGHVCNFTCSAGYAKTPASGDGKKLCKNGGWRGGDIECEAACQARTDPPEVERGNVYCNDTGPLYPVGTFCVHKCDNEGGLFRSSGDERRTCQLGGTWDGEDLVCTSLTVDSTLACSARTDPPEDERGTMHCTESGPPYPIGTTCIYSCNETANFFHKSGDESRTCQEGGTWDGEDEVCALWPDDTTGKLVNFQVYLKQIHFL